MNTAKKVVEPAGVPTKTDSKVIELKPMQKKSLIQADERLEKLNKFLQVRDVHDRLRKKQVELEKLISSEDATGTIQLVITGSNEEVVISNTAVVKEVLNVAKSKLDEIVEESTNTVLTFEL